MGAHAFQVSWSGGVVDGSSMYVPPGGAMITAFADSIHASSFCMASGNCWYGPRMFM